MTGDLAGAAGRPSAGGGPAARVRLSILAWNQFTDWPTLQALGATIERLGFDGLWSWDHLYPINGSAHGPIFVDYPAPFDLETLELLGTDVRAILDARLTEIRA